MQFNPSLYVCHYRPNLSDHLSANTIIIINIIIHWVLLRAPVKPDAFNSTFMTLMSFFLMDRGVDSTCFFLTLCSLTRHTRKSTSVTNDINDVAIPFELTSGPCQRASMHFSRALTLGRLSGNTAMLNGISHTCVWHVRVFTMGKALDCNIMKNISHLHICYSLFQLVYFHYDGLLHPMSSDKDCCFSLSLLLWFFLHWFII